MAKCATCVFHEKDKRLYTANYNEAKTMRLSKHMENARGTIGHVLLTIITEINEMEVI